MNNFEQIKQMTIDEMAEFIREEQVNSIFNGIAFSVDNIKQWLLSEVERGDNK